LILLHPRHARPVSGSELEEGLLKENLDVLTVPDPTATPREHRLRVHFRGSPGRAVTVSWFAEIPRVGDWRDSGEAPANAIEIRQIRGVSPEMEFLADRTALHYQRILGGLLEHGESGREFRSWSLFASYLSEKTYSWPSHLRRRIRHRFGIPEQHFLANVEIGGEPVDLALFPPRLEHVPENAIWVFRLADRGDREARRKFRELIVAHAHLQRGILISGDALRCYERREYPDGVQADRIPFADLGLTPDATLGLVRSSRGITAFRGAPFSLRSLLEAFGDELTDRSFLVLDVEHSSGPIAETLREAGIPAESLPGGTARLDYASLLRLRRLPARGASDIVVADLPDDGVPPPIPRGEPVDPEALRRRLGSRFLCSGKDDVLQTVHVRDPGDAWRLCSYTLTRYLRYYRPDQADAPPPPRDVLERLGELLQHRYLILPEAGPLEEAGAVAVDLYEGHRFWKAGAQGTLERVARLLYQPASRSWSARVFR
jgi:hypothetical protein